MCASFPRVSSPYILCCLSSTILEEEKVQQEERMRMESRRQVTVSWDSGGSDEAPPKVAKAPTPSLALCLLTFAVYAVGSCCLWGENQIAGYSKRNHCNFCSLFAPPHTTPTCTRFPNLLCSSELFEVMSDWIRPDLPIPPPPPTAPIIRLN